MNKLYPLISIILPIYNIENYLSKCMTSVINQTYKNIEIIMVDDGSTDNCGKLCDQYVRKDERIKVFHKINGGLSDARNYGIACANGEYITCIDPDDYVDYDYIEYLYTILLRYNTKLSICQHRIHYDNGYIKDNGCIGNESVLTQVCLEKMLYHNVIDTSAWAKLYHKSLFDSVKYPQGRIFEDVATTYALMMQCSYIAVGYESKYTYMFHSNSIVNSDFNQNKFDLIIMTDEMAFNILNVYPTLKKAVHRRRVYARFSTLNQMLCTEGYLNERNQIIKFIKKNRMKIILDKMAPKRDKFAIAAISVSYRFYKLIWLCYRMHIMR